MQPAFRAFTAAFRPVFSSHTTSEHVQRQRIEGGKGSCDISERADGANAACEACKRHSVQCNRIFILGRCVITPYLTSTYVSGVCRSLAPRAPCQDGQGDTGPGAIENAGLGLGVSVLGWYGRGWTHVILPLSHKSRKKSVGSFVG